MYDSWAQWYAHTYEQFLKLSVGLGLGFVFEREFKFRILYAFLWFSLDYSVLFAFVLLD